MSQNWAGSLEAESEKWNIVQIDRWENGIWVFGTLSTHLSCPPKGALDCPFWANLGRQTQGL